MNLGSIAGVPGATETEFLPGELSSEITPMSESRKLWMHLPVGGLSGEPCRSFQSRNERRLKSGLSRIAATGMQPKYSDALRVPLASGSIEHYAN